MKSTMKIASTIASAGFVIVASSLGTANAATSICDAVAGNIVQNCGFEGGTYNTGPGFAPAVTPDDWTVSDIFSEDSFSNGVRQMPNSGVNNLQIGPASGNVAPGDPSIWQTLTDVSGAKYQGSFYFYTTSGANETITDALLDIQINGVNVFSLPSTIQPDVYRSYTKETFSFIGTGSDLLTIVAGTGNNSAPDWEIDDISVVQGTSAVPEASTWAMMLLGFVCLGFAGYRRPRKTIAFGA